MLLKRVGVGLLTLFVVSILVFIGTEILPGDVAEVMLGQTATPESLAALRTQLNLDQPAWLRYFGWLADLANGDLGSSMTGSTTIETLIKDRFANTMLLAGVVSIVAIPISLMIGITAAMYAGSAIDRTVTTGSLCAVSVPEFFTATILVMVFSIQLKLLPSIARPTPYMSFFEILRTLTLPVLTLSFAIAAQMIRMTRAAVLNVLDAAYIEMGILKGVPRKQIILKHALLNAISPIVNVIALNLAYLVSGVVIVETVFAYPGLAKLMVEGVQTRDMPLVQACAIIFGSIYVVLMMLADLASFLSNPRLRHPK